MLIKKYSTKVLKTIIFLVTAAIIATTLVVFDQNQKQSAQTNSVAVTEEIDSFETSLDTTPSAESDISTPDDITPDVVTEEEVVTTDAVTEPIALPATPSNNAREVITLAGGCFWCSEAYLQETAGVIDVVSGYAGGSLESATYKQVITGKTGHREAVRVTYNPHIISTAEVLDVYWAHLDPTDAGGQFADRGFHYTTAIFYHTPEQKAVAETSKTKLANSGLFTEPIATIILPVTTFFPAEEYHQDYYQKSSDHYERYKRGSGRAGFIDENWAKQAALEFLESEN